MAVKVHKSNGAEETYDKATTLHVAEGHLLVQKVIGTASRHTVAVYAPGEWRYAEDQEQS